MRVLVVDDEFETLNLLRTILEISGYQAFTTLNSVEAITLAEIERPDCILLDIMMPQLDGFTLCKMMRLHPATAHLPIVFVTAYSAIDLEQRRKEAGADMVLPKPIGMDALVETVEKVLSLRANKTDDAKPPTVIAIASEPEPTPEPEVPQTPALIPEQPNPEHKPEQTLTPPARPGPRAETPASVVAEPRPDGKIGPKPEIAAKVNPFIGDLGAESDVMPIAPRMPTGAGRVLGVKEAGNVVSPVVPASAEKKGLP